MNCAELAFSETCRETASRLRVAVVMTRAPKSHLGGLLIMFGAEGATPTSLAWSGTADARKLKLMLFRQPHQSKRRSTSYHFYLPESAGTHRFDYLSGLIIDPKLFFQLAPKSATFSLSFFRSRPGRVQEGSEFSLLCLTHANVAFVVIVMVW